ncbi:MAG: P-protein [bacterium ADurb.Bin400]|nr:MAG: P-protein [bacterium ADurb.Bin400]
MINAVVGATGEMGKNLLIPLMGQLGTVIGADEHSSVEKWQAVWKADVIWLAVPRDAVPTILRGIVLRPDQLVIDICSIKRRLSKTVKQTGAAHLSLHPLHGPFVPVQGQKWAKISTHKDASQNPHAKKIMAYLTDQGINFLDTVSEDHHDFMMGVTLSMPELFTIVVDKLVDTYSRAAGQDKPSMEQIMEWAVPASNALFSAYIHSINSSADWLRKDLIIGAHGNLIESAKEAFGELSQSSLEEINQQLSCQRLFVDALPLEERKRIRQWIERWFVDANQKMFSFHRKKQMKPKLNIQHLEKKSDIFPVHQDKITVGIHGIEGCFTHESALRFCEELGIDSSHLDFKYLVEAERVIKAVVDGEIDRGIFAFANSGSGAYVSSTYAMSKYTFDVEAIYGMEILQCLIADPSVNSADEITEVFGHPQAVSQCKRTFAEKYPDIVLTYGQDSDDTALCVKRIADGELPKTTATLGSQTAAAIYKLKILEYGMHHDPFNTTTFAIIKRKSI